VIFFNFLTAEDADGSQSALRIFSSLFKPSFRIFLVKLQRISGIWYENNLLFMMILSFKLGIYIKIKYPKMQGATVCLSAFP